VHPRRPGKPLAERRRVGFTKLGQIPLGPISRPDQLL
jgi:hypothetical protein